MKVIHKGAIGAMQLREFYCNPCRAHFEAFTKMVGDDMTFEPRTHSCGTLCEIAKIPSRAPAVRGGEWNSVPGDMRKEWQRHWGLTDNQMATVTREDMDRVMRERGLSFTDKSWDDNVNGGKRERGEAVDLPPDTDDPREVEAWNARKYGDSFVREQKQQIRAVFDAASAGTLERLPEADDGAIHETPHIIDPEKTRQQLAAEPVVAPERKKELQGRLVTG